MREEADFLAVALRLMWNRSLTVYGQFSLSLKWITAPRPPHFTQLWG